MQYWVMTGLQDSHMYIVYIPYFWLYYVCLHMSTCWAAEDSRRRFRFSCINWLQTLCTVGVVIKRLQDCLSLYIYPFFSFILIWSQLLDLDLVYPKCNKNNYLYPNLYPKKVLYPKYDKNIYHQYTKEAKQWCIYIYIYIY